jgi:hypothetical protein
VYAVGRMAPTHSVRIARLRIVCLTLTLAACGSPPPPAPPPAVSAAPAPPPPPPAAPPEASAAPPPPAPAPSPPPEPVADSGPKRSQKPIEILTARDAAFLVDYANSDARQRAKESCENAQKEPDKVGACLEKAREAFQPDVIRFKRDHDNNNDWERKIQLVIYKRAGSTLREVSTGLVELTPEGEDAVRVKLGKQKGSRPLWRGQPSALIKAPNDYSIELEDAELGKLRYDAKIGLVTD